MNNDNTMPTYNIVHRLTFAALIAAMLVSCKPEPEGELGTPFSKMEGLTATSWEIERVVIVDGADPAKTERDFSSFYLGGENKLTAKFDADGTFDVTPGDGLNFLPLSGTWQFNDPMYPTQIVLNPEGDTQILYLESPTRIIETRLRLRFDKHECLIDDEWAVVYSYGLIFKRVD